MSKTNVLLSKRVPLTVALLLGLAILPAWSEEEIVLDGSSGMLPLVKVLATAYQQKSSSPQVAIGKGLGTGARLQALAENKIQIALASHGIQPEDVQKGNLKVIEVAKGAIVFAVNASVSVTNITEAQVCDIYSGKVQNWQSLGGPDSAIVVLTRPPTEVDPEVIRAKIGCFKALKEVETAKVMARGPDMAKGLVDTPHAIGMTSMTVVEQSGGKVKALTVNSIAPTAENVKSGRYFLTRDFLFVTKGEPTLPIKKFLDFVLSPEGDRVILANGAVPLR
ncbi:phosphate ABC transporter substrate-binding protein [Polaromonas sp. P1-6]|nr:phosphate ABC transporter substrate-binding protein [Polaromonas sp. P1-6]